MQRPPRNNVLRYGTAVLGVALATAARLALDPILGDHFPFATLFFAVLVVGGYGGRGPALLATVLGALASARFLLPPRGSFSVEGAENQAGLVLYVTIGLGIALLGLDPAHVALVEGVLKEENRSRSTTVVWATHNLFQARRVAHRVALLLEGKLIEVQETARFFESPSDPRAAAFVRGEMVY